MGPTSLPYPRYWAEGVLKSFISKHARATDVVLKTWPALSKSLIVSWIRWNDPKWRNFKRGVEYTEAILKIEHDGKYLTNDECSKRIRLYMAYIIDEVPDNALDSQGNLIEN